MLFLTLVEPSNTSVNKLPSTSPLDGIKILLKESLKEFSVVFLWVLFSPVSQIFCRGRGRDQKFVLAVSRGRGNLRTGLKEAWLERLGLGKNSGVRKSLSSSNPSNNNNNNRRRFSMLSRVFLYIRKHEHISARPLMNQTKRTFSKMSLFRYFRLAFSFF